MPDYPTLIPETRTPATVTLSGYGIQFPALFSPDSATAQRVLEFFTADITPARPMASGGRQVDE